MPAETTAFGSFTARAEQTRPGRRRRRRRSGASRSGKSDRSMGDGVRSEPNVSACVCSLSCCAHSSAASPSLGCRTTPTAGSAQRKGPAQGVLPPTRTGPQRRDKQMWGSLRTSQIQTQLYTSAKVEVSLPKDFFSYWFFLSPVVLTWTHVLQQSY